MASDSQRNEWPQAKKIFGLIIGINEYKFTKKLTGAVADAEAVKNFLEGIGVDPNRIQVLRDRDATRSKIKDAFTSLKDNRVIERDDSIIVYYAGHGTEMEPKDENGRKRQGIVPVDAEPKEGSSDRTLPIPDFEIGSWLNDLAEKKPGANITVIFDCCHSSSGTRDGPDVGGVSVEDDNVKGDSREVQFEGALPSNGGITNDRSQDVASGFSNRDCRSHVLLAACGADEKARERDQRGLFTVQLLEKLGALNVDKLSYEEFMENFPALKADNQNPQCEGHHKDRILFSTRKAKPHPVFFRVIHVEGKKYRVEKADKIYGITDGSIFDVYEKEKTESEFLGTLSVKFESGNAYGTPEIPGRDKVSTLAYGRQVGVAPDQRLPVHCEGDLFAMVSQCGKLNGYIDLVEKDQAKLIVRRSAGSDKVVLETNREDVTRHGFHQLHMPHNVPVSSEHPEFLISASNWNLHLDNCRPKQWNNGVNLEFFLLEPDGSKVDKQFRQVFREKRSAVREDLIPGRKLQNNTFPHYVIPDNGSSLDKNTDYSIADKGVIDLVIDRKDMYGIKVRNNTQMNLYPSLFFFDVSEQSIASYYKPPVAGPDAIPDAPLRKGSSFTIGYGTDGAVPFRYGLRPGVDLDVGFLKLYLSTTPVDLQFLEQLPFRHRMDDRTIENRIKRHSWGTITCTVVQRRYAKPT